MSGRLYQQPFVPWTTKASQAIPLAANAGPFVIAPARVGWFYQLMGFRLILAENLIAAAAGAVDFSLQSVGGASTVNLFDAVVYVPAAALVTTGVLYDSGWTRYDPVGFGSVSAGTGGNLQLAWGIGLTGLIAMQVAFNLVPA